MKFWGFLMALGFWCSAVAVFAHALLAFLLLKSGQPATGEIVRAFIQFVFCFFLATRKLA